MTVARSAGMLPDSLSPTDLSKRIQEWMHPYSDTPSDTLRGVLDALEGRPAPGGFIIIASSESSVPSGALVMLKTGMRGYIPPNLLLFLAVDPSRRRSGIGSRLLQKAVENSHGPIKLHVEPDNPALSLYRKNGFSPAYLDMRLIRNDEGADE